MRDASRYVDLGAKVGVGAGMVLALQGESGQRDDLLIYMTQLFAVLGGWVVGMAVGVAMYFAQH